LGVVASAPAKVILFGEHFVVYGEPAIVLAIDKRAYAKVELRNDKRVHVRSTNLGISGYFEDNLFRLETGNEQAKYKLEPIKKVVDKISEISGKTAGLDVEIRSTVPVAAGLGSSAAVAAATAMAVAKILGVELSKEEIFRITYEAERIVHGTPSGVDPAIATFGGTILFQMDTGVKPLEAKMDIPLVIGDTRVSRSTRNLVAQVREKRKRFPSIVDPILRSGRQIVLRAIEAIRQGDIRTLGELANINHALLCAIGVSSESLEWLITNARKAGALGAKLTGAGGGGCMIALAEPDRLEAIAEAIQRAGGTPYVARKTDHGVRIES
jgi:mevalonate kinase